MDIKKTIKKTEYTHAVRKATGWSRKEAQRRLDDARDNGIMYKTYVGLGYWMVPEEELLAVHINKTRRRLAKELAEKRGVNRLEIERQMIEARYVHELRYKDFVRYDWDLMTAEERADLMIRPHSRDMSHKFRTEDARPRIFNSKSMFNKYFSEFVNRKWVRINNELTFDDFRNAIAGFDGEYCIYKPQKLSGGSGIEKCRMPENYGEARALYDVLMQTGEKGIFEEFIIQHEKMNLLCSDSVNSTRIVTLYLNGECKILFAGCRMGRAGSSVDNVSMGGLAANIDIKTGIIDTIAVGMDNIPHETHPDSGCPIKGFEIPNWDQAVELVKQASKKAFEIGGLAYAGWDVAYTPEGPVLIEGNNWPSPAICQHPRFVERREGMRHIVAPYLDDSFEFKY